ncbi:hypothetical protein CORC01_02308 [Colletotrichum orchidophilum]|uniref:Uncharacterized protein n=1 Tax=Colletotrichum orchidophilum TaxID=1209926 RepID=A0A1G4BLV6_9PEZI|nr:uncharacterized protein CORC01_02308 [Colletotrichum orchidophilum]OHF02315.1 hypothetical protein CORC01_02308 [Colletotrichum orchidophilum]
MDNVNRNFDILSIYRRGRYIPQRMISGVDPRTQPIPAFLRLNPLRRADLSSGSFVDTLPSLKSTNLDKFLRPDSQTCRTCPQCAETLLGPEPIGANGRPVPTVCENCRQSNIREQVLRNIAAEALLLLHSGAVPVHDSANRTPYSPPKEEESRTLSWEYEEFQPHRPSLCVRCKRPGVPCAPGRRRCAECISILIAFGPDENPQEGGDGQTHQHHSTTPQPSSRLTRQSRIHNGAPQLCDVCRSKHVPAGTKRCEDCIAPDTPATPLTAYFTSQGCILCEHNYVVAGKSYCRKCLYEGTTGAAPLQALHSLPAAEIMQCSGCGHQVHRTPEGCCRDCRESGPSGSGRRPQNPALDDDEDDELLDRGSSMDTLIKTKCGCGKNFAPQSRILCVDCLAARRMVGSRGWPAWKKKHWPVHRRRWNKKTGGA